MKERSKTEIRITDRKFFTEPAEKLARNLLGKIICRRVSDDRTIRFRITETEAYCHDDTACHSNKYKSGNGVVSQNMIGGTLYVHYNNKDYPGSSFDIIANETNIGEGVLIRGGMNLDNPKEVYESHPRLLGEALQIDYNTLNQVDLLSSKEIWIADDKLELPNEVKIQKRVGLGTADDITEEDKNRLLRFTLILTKHGE